MADEWGLVAGEGQFILNLAGHMDRPRTALTLRGAVMNGVTDAQVERGLNITCDQINAHINLGKPVPHSRWLNRTWAMMQLERN